MANQKTLLSKLRSRSEIDCDTLDVEGMLHIEQYEIKDYLTLNIFCSVAQALGPFVDCTSNQVGCEKIRSVETVQC